MGEWVYIVQDDEGIIQAAFSTEEKAHEWIGESKSSYTITQLEVDALDLEDFNEDEDD